MAVHCPLPNQTSLPWALTQRILALALLVLLTPLFALLFVIVKTTTRGSFLFKQERPGLGGKPFQLLKIRTMKVNSENTLSYGFVVPRNCDDITPIGKLLRDLKIDELPQLWNVVKGDMELVGPRPITFTLYEKLSHQIPGFESRNLLKPGLTNLAQATINRNLEGGEMIYDWNQRFQCESHYLKHKSTAYDLIVIFLTVMYLTLAMFGKVWSRSPKQTDNRAMHAT